MEVSEEVRNEGSKVNWKEAEKKVKKRREAGIKIDKRSSKVTEGELR